MKPLRKKRECGQALVEFALVLPILLLLVCGIIDFGWIYSNKLMVELSARDATRYASIHAEGSDSAALTTLVTTYVKNNIMVNNKNAVAVNAIYSDPDVTVTVQYPVPVLTPITSTLLGNTFTVKSTCVMKAE